MADVVDALCIGPVLDAALCAIAWRVDERARERQAEEAEARGRTHTAEARESEI
jgi:hypothetical protein